MKNLTLEDVIQRNFGLKGNLYKPDGTFSKEGNEAYGRFTDLLGDLSNHVALHIDSALGGKILALIEVFDRYEGGGPE